MQHKIAYISAMVFAIAIVVSYYYFLSAPAGQPVALNITASALVKTLPGYNVSMVTAKSDVFSGVLKSEGYLSAADQVFDAKTDSANTMIIDFMVIKAANSSVSNSTLRGELSLTNDTITTSGSHFELLKIKNYSKLGSIIPIYELLDIGSFNQSVVNRSVNSGLSLMPYYQFTSIFYYKNYYGSVVINAYSNSSLAANASLYLAGYLLNNTIT